jgi:hypothetical protein
MLPSAVNDTMRDMMAKIRDVGDGIRGGTYTMTAPIITGGTITGVALTGNTFTTSVISGGSINNTPIGATTANTGRFSDLTDTGLTSGRVVYAGTGGNLVDDADFTFNGTTLTLANDASISGLTVGKGAGSVVSNTVLGNSSLPANTTGSQNTAIGQQVLVLNTTGTANSGLAYGALYANTTGSNNTAIGQFALQANTTASGNTAVGYQAGYSNTTGAFNTFIGLNTGYSVTTGSNNTFIGSGGVSGVINSAGYAMTTGSKNTIIGNYTGNNGGLDIRTASNYIVLSDGDGVPRLYIDTNGNLNCQKVYDTTTANAVNVHIRNDGFLLRSTSALKYKQNIRDLENIDINKFRPVRYKSKSEMDDQTKDHFGIVADEVAEAGITELVSYGAEGEVEGFQYERFTVVLLKALQELNAKVEAQALEIATLKGQ